MDDLKNRPKIASGRWIFQENRIFGYDFFAL